MIFRENLINKFSLVFDILKFYLIWKDFTLALLVMLVTNCMFVIVKLWHCGLK